MAKPPTPLQQAQAITRAQYAPADYALGRANAQSKAEQAALAATGAALLKQLQAGVAPAGRTYDAAVGQQQALAQGGANLLASLSPNPQVQSELAAVNAPNAQRAQLAAALQAQYPGQGAVLNIEQGTIPGASLAAERASTQRYLAGLPTLAALAEQQSARSLLARAADTRDKLLEQRLGITGQIPGLAQQIQQHLDSLRESAATRAYNAQQAALAREFTANQNLLGRQFTAKQNRLSRTASKGGKGGGAGYQLRTLPDGTTVVFNPNTGRSINVGNFGKPTAATDKALRGLSPNKVRQYKGDAYKIALNAIKGIDDTTGQPFGITGTDSSGNPIGTPAFGPGQHPSYNETLQEMLSRSIPVPIAVAALNRFFPVKYRVTKRGTLKQVGGPKPKKVRNTTTWTDAGPVPGS